MVRENGNAFANAYKYIKEQNEAEASKYQSAIAEAAKKHQDTIDKIYNIRESREVARRQHSKLVEDCKNDALSTIIKAIYIEALCPGSLTDDALFLAESMVDGWIQEKGGASRIIAECRNKTYLLNRICSLTEEVALENVREIEFNESEGMTLKEQEEVDEEKKAQITQMLAQANSLIAKATALQNGDETVLDDAEADKADAEKVEDEAPVSNDVVDASQPVEEEQDEEAPAENIDTSDADEGDPDLGDIDNEEEASTEEESKEEEKAEEEAPEEEPEAEKEEDSKEEEKSEESESDDDDDDEKEDDEDSDDDDEEAEFDDDSELTEEEEDEAEEDDNDLSDPDLGDIDDEESTEDMEAGEDEDQQDAEAELTGESDDDETVDDEEEINNTSIDGENTEPQGKIFDELDKEEDVKKAVQLISQRVADAEEDFIQRNAEDKKKIDDLLGKISDNIKTVENLSDNDSTQSKIAQESTMMLRRKIKNITENRPQSVFEKMARKLTENVTKDSDLRSIYLAESGRTDVASVIEHTKVMYGFLEALSVLQLEKVDSAYIENVLKSM